MIYKFDKHIFFLLRISQKDILLKVKAPISSKNLLATKLCGYDGYIFQSVKKILNWAQQPITTSIKGGKITSGLHLYCANVHMALIHPISFSHDFI